MKKKKKRNRPRRRAQIRIPKRKELAAPPGSVEPAPHTSPSHAEVLRYGPEGFTEETLEELSSIAARRGEAVVSWFNVEGLKDAALFKEFADVFGWHMLVVEDVVSSHQRPKAEDYEDHAYIVLHMPSLTEEEGLSLEQLSVLFAADYAVTIQAGAPGDPLEPVRERIRKARGRIRTQGGDYLAYAITDAIIDHYFPIVEQLNARLERVEADLGQIHDEEVLRELHAVRNDLHTIWRTISATREAIGRLVRGEIEAVSETTRLYLRDCLDHCAQLLDATEACQELSASLMALHQSALNNQLSAGMRILTMISTIFIPMSFIAGVYGMNFDRAASPLNMPELGWYAGYPFALALMFSVGASFLIYFKRRGWL